MSEPTYEYIKGIGWVPDGVPDEYEFENINGFWKLINRMPKDGERYGLFTYRHDQEKFFVTKTRVNLVVFAEHIIENHRPFQIYSICRGGRVADADAYCTILFAPTYAELVNQF